MNLQEIIQKTKSQIDEIPGTSTQYRIYQIRREIQEAQDDIVRRGLKNPVKFLPELLTKDFALLTEGVSDYQAPSDFLFLHFAKRTNITCRIVERSEFEHGFSPSDLDPTIQMVDRELVRVLPIAGVGDSLDLHYVRRSHELFQQISTFESSESWTGTDVAFTTNATALAGSEKEGTVQGIELTRDSSGVTVASWVPATNLVLGNTAGNSSALSIEESDSVEIFVYTTDKTNLTSVEVEFHTTLDSAFYEVVYLAAAIDTGGVYLRTPKSEFTKTGSPSWHNVDQVRIKVNSSGPLAFQPVVADLRIYRTPEVDIILHAIMSDYAASKLLSSDEGWRQKGDPANLFASYESRVERYFA